MTTNLVLKTIYIYFLTFLEARSKKSVSRSRQGQMCLRGSWEEAIPGSFPALAGGGGWLSAISAAGNLTLHL